MFFASIYSLSSPKGSFVDDGESPNITADLFKLRVVICQAGFEWVIAKKQAP